MNRTSSMAPPAQFNFAQHLLQANRARAGKTVVIDDLGQLTYGDLAGQVQRFVTGLRSLGLRREDRVLLLMHDSSDWIVAFLGALYAGVVPVAVNTLLTAQDYAYMLAHSRAIARKRLVEPRFISAFKTNEIPSFGGSNDFASVAHQE